MRSAGWEAISAAMISESEVERNRTPWPVSSLCSSTALIRLPLWASATGRRRDGIPAVSSPSRWRRLSSSGLPDRHVAGERLEAPLVEHRGNQAQLTPRGDVPALAGRDAGRLLAAVLERIEREIGEPRNVQLRGVDTEYPALVAGTLTLAQEISS